MKKIIYLFAFVFALSSCSTKSGLYSGKKSKKNIVILYENDVHCGIDGYTKFAGLRDAIQRADTAWVAAVSCGDYLQGGTVGSLSRGQLVIDILRNVGYDAMTIGNHEFDYGTPHMKELLKGVNAPVVCANFYDMGAQSPCYPAYVIHKYGKKRVAFVGAVTPETMQSESYSIFDDDGRQLYDLKAKELIPVIQQAVDKARKEKADYVVLLSHLGEKVTGDWTNSHQVVAGTRGIDVVLDGHSHSPIPHETVSNLDGKPVIITQTGTQFANVGKLIITKKGQVSTELIPLADISYTSNRVSAVTDSVKAALKPIVGRTVATCPVALEINGPDGKRIVRSQETNLGDIIADAFRNAMDAEIGLVNGGGIRNTIPAGNITYEHVVNTLPFENYTCLIEAKGSDICNMLEKCTAKTPQEDGFFPQISGMRYTINTANHTVTDVQVFDKASGSYQAIDPNRSYTIGTNSYYSTGGFYDTLKHCKLLKQTRELMCDTFAKYLEETLGGTVGTDYQQPQGRITIK